MKNLKNSISLTGFAGKDPEFKTFESGKTKASVSIAVDDSYSDQAENKVEKTYWFDLAFWGEKLELARLISKGTKFTIDGKLTSRNYESNGEKRTAIEVLVMDLEIIRQPKIQEAGQ